MPAVSAIVGALGSLDRQLGISLGVLDKATDLMLRVLDEARSREVRLYLDAIKQDQAAVIQLTPEAMDLFQAGIENRPGVRYQSTASMAPPPTPLGLAKKVIRPWEAASNAIFATLYGITSRYDERYPCGAVEVPPAADKTMLRAFGRSPGLRANDGVVPLRSQIWGELVWAGYGDHLDVLGHFKEERGGERHKEHVDWLTSGAAFDSVQFAALMRAIADGMRTER
jgi:hypothetical protein